MRLHSDFVTAAERGTLFSEEFFEGIIVYDIATETFYKIISTTVSQGDYVYAGYEKIINLSEVVTDDEFAEEIANLKEELIEYIDEYQHELTMLDFVNTISLASEELNNVKINGGVVAYSDAPLEDDRLQQLVLGGKNTSKGQGVIIDNGETTLVLGG